MERVVGSNGMRTCVQPFEFSRRCIFKSCSERGTCDTAVSLPLLGLAHCHVPGAADAILGQGPLGLACSQAFVCGTFAKPAARPRLVHIN